MLSTNVRQVGHKVENDETASSRKEDHIDLAFKASVAAATADPRFNYEPLLSGHQPNDADLSLAFVNKHLTYPLWVSSMTGGTEKAKTININLARICGEYGLGMGLGSCRQLLNDDKRLVEFDIRQYMPESPLFINLGIAQVEQMLAKKELSKIGELIDRLKADGLIIHVNPLQEWLQPEGDLIKVPPIETIQDLLSEVSYPVIIKEVGQGFGPESLKALLSLPIAAIELAGYGGTNFSKLELMRASNGTQNNYEQVLHLGHDCEEMIQHINSLKSNHLKETAPLIIISGGIKTFLDGYFLMQKCQLPSIYAQASGFLKHAMDIEALRSYVKSQIDGLKMAHALLKVKV